MRIALDIQATRGRKTGIGHYAAQLLTALRQVAPDHTYLPLDWGRDPAMRLDQRLRRQQWEARFAPQPPDVCAALRARHAPPERLA